MNNMVPVENGGGTRPSPGPPSPENPQRTSTCERAPLPPRRHPSGQRAESGAPHPSLLPSPSFLPLSFPFRLVSLGFPGVPAPLRLGGPLGARGAHGRNLGRTPLWLPALLCGSHPGEQPCTLVSPGRGCCEPEAKRRGSKISGVDRRGSQVSSVAQSFRAWFRVQSWFRTFRGCLGVPSRQPQKNRGKTSKKGGGCHGTPSQALQAAGPGARREGQPPPPQWASEFLGKRKDLPSSLLLLLPAAGV